MWYLPFQHGRITVLTYCAFYLLLVSQCNLGAGPLKFLKPPFKGGIPDKTIVCEYVLVSIIIIRAGLFTLRDDMKDKAASILLHPAFPGFNYISQSPYVEFP